MQDLRLLKSGMVDGKHYRYTNDLLALDNQQKAPEGSLVSMSSPQPHSPLVVKIWGQFLKSHPDRVYTRYLLSGIEKGFRIGFNRGRQQILQKSIRNLPTQVPSIISEYLDREVSLSRMMKLPKGVRSSGVHISPLGAIPKKNKPGKWRLIVDLSSPPGHSVNDGISTESSSLSYPSIDHLATIIVSEGHGSFMVKADIKEAYRMLLIHPEDQPLLGVSWENSIYIDKALPFGLRSAPKIFSAVADAIQWILLKKGIVNSLHYLDDFILVAKRKEDAQHQMSQLVAPFSELGVPLEQSKLEGPSQSLTFLDIEIDTVSCQLRLPREKILRLKEMLSSCIQKISLTKKELQSLVGLLQFATKVIRLGRPFLQRLYAMQQIGSSPSHHIRLNAPARADMLWWHLFVDRWNGISILWDLQRQASASLSVYTDASGSWGCGAYGAPHWLSLKWNARLQPLPTATKELIPVILVAAR